MIGGAYPRGRKPHVGHETTSLNVRRRWVPVQLAEAAAEVHVLLDAELLIAEKDHQTIHQRIMYLLELLVTERFGKVNTKNFSADAWRRFG